MANIYRSEAGRQIVEGLYRKALQRWPVPSAHLVVPTRAGDTFVVASGDAHASPLVLFHGSGANSAAWIRDVAEWSRQFRVYAVDMIGEPGLSVAARPSFESDEYAAWLDDVWKGLGLTAASVVGVSLGGWLALDYAIRRPHRVASLSLLSPTGIGSRNAGFMIKAGLLSLLGVQGLRKSVKLVAGRDDIPPPLIVDMTTVFRHFRPRWERLPIRTDGELAALATAVQVIVGGKDVMIRSNETRDRMRRLVPNLQLTYLEDEGHLLPRQTAAISAFVNAAAGSTAREAVPA